MKRIVPVLSGVLFLSASLTALAASDRTPSFSSPPIVNWQAPAFFSAAPAGGRTALTDAAPPMPYIPVVPCRQYDSRNSTVLLNNTARTVTLSGAPCGIPTTAVAVAVNITVFNIVAAASNGVFKVGTVAPPPTAWINYPFSETQRGNAGVVSTTGPANIVVQVNQGLGSVDFVVDVFGYYGPEPATATNYFTLTNNSGGFTMYLTNLSTTCGGGCGLVALVHSGIGVYGGAQGVGATHGVEGYVDFDVPADAAAVYGESGSTARTYGVYGITNSTANDAAGVLGKDGAGAGASSPQYSAGVRGEGRFGVYGISNASGGGGVVGLATAPNIYGVYSFGQFAATGTKNFIEPHPTDPTMVIRYVSLEGPEAGTYFRGTATTVNREAIIPVPDSFRMVSDAEGLTVQLTPVGALAQLAVISQDLDRIVVKSSRDVTFHYHVNGIRRAFKDWQVVAEGSDFRPVSPDQKMPSYLTEEAKTRLIANGTYNPDGTVNMRTAERLGWTAAWAERDKPK